MFFLATKSNFFDFNRLNIGRFILGFFVIFVSNLRVLERLRERKRGKFQGCFKFSTTKKNQQKHKSVRQIYPFAHSFRTDRLNRFNLRLQFRVCVHSFYLSLSLLQLLKKHEETTKISAACFSRIIVFIYFFFDFFFWLYPFCCCKSIYLSTILKSIPI